MVYHVIYGLAWLVSLLPYPALYALSDCLYLIVYHLVRYRRGIVRRNLASSFPEKDKKAIVAIERRFYHWLCDYGMETLKLLTVSDSELLRHLEFRNCEEVEACFDEGQPCAGLLGHYCNWEYLSATALGMRRWGVDGVGESRAVMGLIYKPLRSKAMDRLFLKLRSRKHGTCVDRKDILRQLVRLHSEGRMSFFGYIADQGPKWENIHLWLTFLGHDTPVFTGSERIIRKMQHAVFYLDMERPRRGKYVCTMRLLTRHPEEMSVEDLTALYFTFLEKSIRRSPEFYLWTHNRWKRTHEEFLQREQQRMEKQKK